MGNKAGFLRWILCFAAVFCSRQLFAGGGYEIGVDSTPPGAKVYVGARMGGTTPCKVQVNDGSHLFLALEGYTVASSTISKASDLSGKTLNFSLSRAFSAGYDPEKGLVDAMREKTGDFNLAVDFAIYESRITALAYLLSLGAPLDARGPSGLTPLMLAVSYGNYVVVDWLLRNGASATLATYVSPLVVAMEAQRQDMVDRLKSAGAKVNAAMIHNAASAGYANAVRWLVTLEGVSVDIRDGSGRTALIVASQGARQGVVKTLLDLGADASLRDSSGGTALSYARAALEKKYPGGKGIEGDSKPSEYNIVQLLETAPQRVTIQPTPQAAPQPVAQQTSPQTVPPVKVQKRLMEVRGKSVAIIGLVPKGVDPLLPGIVTDFLLDAFVNVGNMRVVDRSSIDKIIQEQAFQMSDIVDNSKVAQIGKVSGAEYVVTGSLSKIEQTIYLNIKLISVTTAEIVGSSVAPENPAKDKTNYVELCREAVQKLFVP